MPPDDTLRMPVLELDTLLGRARDGDEPVFPLVRRRVPRLSNELLPLSRASSSGVSIVLGVTVVLGTAVLYLLR